MRRALLLATLALLSLLAAGAGPAARSAAGAVAVLTQHNDNARSGANLNETVLTTANVNLAGFGKVYSRAVGGQVYAQPLYVADLPIPGQGTHNVVFVATMHNDVFAFDADDPAAATPLWHANLGPAAPNSDFGQTCGTYTDITVEVGTTSTPVIDLGRNTIYLVALSKENGRYFHRLHALDLGSGQERPGSPVVVSGSVPGSGAGGSRVVFASATQLQRVSLVLANGIVYFGFASYCDTPPFYGWLFGYDAGTLQQRAIYNANPNGAEASIWQSGQGLTADGAGNLYALTSNGVFDGDSGGPDLGDSFLRLAQRGNSLQVADWFTPYNQAALSAQDVDLGASAALLIPGTPLLLGGGKEGKLYLVDSTNMGHYQPDSDSQIVQSWVASNGEIHGNPVYWDGPHGPLVYLWPEGDRLKAFAFDPGQRQFNTTPITAPSATSGGLLAISAQGSAPGSGILWAVRGTGTLYAFDAANFPTELWNSDRNSARDSLGTYSKFLSPTVAGGHVFMGTRGDQLVVYGLLPPRPTPTPGGPASPTPGGPTATPPPGGCAWYQYGAPGVPGAALTQLDGVAPIGANDVWAIGHSSSGAGQAAYASHWNGASWVPVAVAPAQNPVEGLLSLVAVAPNDVWAAGSSGDNAGHTVTLIEHWDGTAWRRVPSPNGPSALNVLHTIRAASGSDLWAAGYSAPSSAAANPSGVPSSVLFEHWDGTAWSVVPAPDAAAGGVNRILGLEQLGHTGGWAVGVGGPLGGAQHSLLERWDGAAWQLVAGPATGSDGDELDTVNLSGRLDVWAVGKQVRGGVTSPLVEHYDGRAWSLVAVPTPAGATASELRGVAAFAANDVWLAGSYTLADGTRQGLTEHFDGSAWTILAGPPAGAGNRLLLTAIDGSGSGEIWTVGANGDPLGATPGGLPYAARFCLVTGAATVTPTPAGSPPAPTPCALTFSDVSSSDYFYRPVQYLVCHGILSGYGDDTFRPYANATRGQIAKILVNGLQIPGYVPPGGGHTFADVLPGSAYFGFVEAAARATIISGYDCGNPEPCDSANRPYFRPNAAVTRGQLAKMIVVAAGWPAVRPVTYRFADVLPDNPIFAYAETAACRGVLSGYTCGAPGAPCDSRNRPYFRRFNNATRGQVAKIVYNAITAATGCSPLAAGP